MLYSGSIIDNTYQVCEEIGSGGMGVIYLAYHLRLDKYVVLKKMKNSAANMLLLRNEVDVLKSLHHPYLPQVYDFIHYEGDVYTVIDYIDGCDLKNYIDQAVPIDESQLIKWLVQLCEVLEYLHTHTPRVLHTDIKPANIIVTGNGDICLIDFGISVLGNEEIKGFSMDYSSPEQYYNVSCIQQGYGEALIDLDERTDIYSLGATFYHLITGLKPNCTVQLPQTASFQNPYVSDTLCSVIDRAIAYDRENRFPDARSMRKAVNDIYKSSVTYRRYVLIQIAAAVLSCLMILSGSYLIVEGINNNLVAAFEADYNAYVDAMRLEDSHTAIARAKKLINSQDYQSVMETEIKAEIFHGMGQCYHAAGDDQNALDCYYQATVLCEDRATGEVYYCDYALLLIECGRSVEAKTVLEKMDQQYPDSASGYLILTQLAVDEGNLSLAREYASVAMSQAAQTDTLYTAYLLMGDIESKSLREQEAIRMYELAGNTKMNAVVLRKLGGEQLKLAAKRGDTSLYRSALATYQALYENYAPTEDDAFNLAQCYLLSEGANGAYKCMEVLERYISRYGKKCRASILLAIAADAVRDSNTAAYCSDARRIFLGLSDEEKSKIDSESLSTIQQLYRKYFKEEW